MTTTLLTILAIAVMLGALLVIPLGVPGTWIMVAVLAVAAVLGEVGITTVTGLLLLAGAAEVIEFVLVRRMNARYGGSRRAFWGAIAGGFAGVVLGTPVPIIGSVLGAIVGTFVGAAAVAWWETREVGSATRVGRGVVLARVLAAGVKTGAGMVILVVGVAALVVG